MNPETLTALKESIAHWKRMRDNPDCGETPGWTDCAFCSLFAHGPEKKKWCEDCPIREATDLPACGGTPYCKAESAFRRLQDGVGTLQDWQEAAQAEIDFLEGLLPKGDN